MTTTPSQQAVFDEGRRITAGKLRRSALLTDAGTATRQQRAELLDEITRGIAAVSPQLDQRPLHTALCEAHQAVTAADSAAMRAVADKLDPAPQIAGAWISGPEAADQAGLQGAERHAALTRVRRWIQANPGDVRADADDAVLRIPADRAAELVTPRRRSRRRP